MGKYRLDTQVALTFEDGQIRTVLNGQVIDLMKLDSAAEFRTVLWSIASQALADQMNASTSPVSSTVPMPPAEGPDLSGYAEQIRKNFQDQADKAQERLHELTSAAAAPNANPA